MEITAPRTEEQFGKLNRRTTISRKGAAARRGEAVGRKARHRVAAVVTFRPGRTPASRCCRASCRAS